MPPPSTPKPTPLVSLDHVAAEIEYTEGQTSTIGVAGIPLNRDEVTVV
jgi:hypothetical protein